MNTQEYVLILMNDVGVVNLLSLTLAIAGIFFSAYFYLKGKKEKLPTYKIRSTSLIRENIKLNKDISISYKNEPIEELTMSKISIWNRGSDVINSSDVAKADPIAIKIPNEHTIYSVEIDHITSHINQFSVQLSEDRKTVAIEFDYFQKNEGAIFKIFHSAPGSNSLKITGSIKGAGKIKDADTLDDDYYAMVFLEKFLNPVLPSKSREKRKAMMLFLILLTLPITLLLILLGGLRNLLHRSPTEFKLLNLEN
ncbi:hypothetical protein NTGBS_880031 [Candidatus Nitrotoga sp. BS]|uniref:hypothetical protein n=1 Tax=Candidatus Nitrotoga sp. BS TaxID=2890408 RepID=UPI001EF191DA|nr:hypothetical protein [Candidatus Nitrotoga sp. BS]CAH1211039.1 hypothetical protein NTGBS_880031 [Candidatus Nitrotoga sp. BS]